MGVIIPNMRSSALGRLSGGSVVSWIMVERMKGPPRVIMFEDEPLRVFKLKKGDKNLVVRLIIFCVVPKQSRAKSSGTRRAHAKAA